MGYTTVEVRMIVELRVSAEFEAAHCLPSLPDGHKCRRMHGHRYEVEIACSGEPTGGYLVEYETMQAELATILGVLDHRNINDVINPSTTETLCAWVWEQLKTTRIGDILAEVRIRETGPDVLRGARLMLIAISTDDATSTARQAPEPIREAGEVGVALPYPLLATAEDPLQAAVAEFRDGDGALLGALPVGLGLKSGEHLGLDADLDGLGTDLFSGFRWSGHGSNVA